MAFEASDLIDIVHTDDFVGRGDCFNIVNINIHSIRNKRDRLETEINRYGRIHVIVVTESWVQEGFENNYNLEGYQTYQVTRGMAMGV